VNKNKNKERTKAQIAKVQTRIKQTKNMYRRIMLNRRSGKTIELKSLFIYFLGGVCLL